MKKVFCIAFVLLLAFIPLALAGVVDSREIGDIPEVEVVEVQYVEDEEELAPTFEPETRTTPNAESTPNPNNPVPSATPEANPGVTPEANPSVTPEPMPAVTSTPQIVEVVTQLDEDDPVPPETPVIQIVETPEEFEDLYEDINTTYELTITYISIDGTPIGDPVRISVEGGEPINIPAITVENFTPAGTNNSSTMPFRDTEVTVIYVPEGFDEEIISINKYNTPLGLGSSIMNVGVCVE